MQKKNRTVVPYPEKKQVIIFPYAFGLVFVVVCAVPFGGGQQLAVEVPGPGIKHMPQQ